MINYMGKSYKSHAELMADVKAGHVRTYKSLLTSFRSAPSMEASAALDVQAYILMNRFGMTGTEIEALES